MSGTRKNKIIVTILLTLKTFKYLLDFSTVGLQKLRGCECWERPVKRAERRRGIPSDGVGIFGPDRVGIYDSEGFGVFDRLAAVDEE
jgi:hypothetical protein